MRKKQKRAQGKYQEWFYLSGVCLNSFDFAQIERQNGVKQVRIPSF